MKLKVFRLLFPVLVILFIQFGCKNIPDDSNKHITMNVYYQTSVIDSLNICKKYNTNTIEKTILDDYIVENIELNTPVKKHNNYIINANTYNYKGKIEKCCYEISYYVNYDSIIPNNPFRVFGKNQLNHSVSGNVVYHVCEIKNHIDTLNHEVITKFKASFWGDKRREHNNNLVYMVIEKEFISGLLSSLHKQFTDVNKHKNQYFPEEFVR